MPLYTAADTVPNRRRTFKIRMAGDREMWGANIQKPSRWLQHGEVPMLVSLAIEEEGADIYGLTKDGRERWLPEELGLPGSGEVTPRSLVCRAG